jgi:tetratricopeptide (TPR) repeat protein
MKRLSRKRTLLFKAISIGSPLLVLGLLEVFLRLFHFGYDMSLFIESRHDKNFLVFNPDASKKYFTDEEIATRGNVELFRKEKDNNTFRIFVLGESTTIGFPYFHNGSFHRWLQYRLTHTFPDKNFEIINVSLTAVNSYTVLGFAREVVNYEPDAILIYTGHNEYYGALGVGSTNKIGGSPAMINLILALREWKVSQLLSKVIHGIATLFGSKKNMSGKTRMELMAADQQIPFGSKLFQRGIDQFKSNMDKTLSLFNQHHIPVFIGNLVCNEKDLKPFVSVEPDSARVPGFRRNYLLGVRAFENDDREAATTYFAKAFQLCGTHALCTYYLARLAYLRGDFLGAGEYFSRAKELDALRFRAPDSMNTVIEELCRKYDNTHFVDLQAAFKAYSDHHIIGSELILEHVHPNLSGYALISDCFYNMMIKEGHFDFGPGKEMSYPELLRDMPVTRTDSLAGAYRVFSLKHSWPFTDTPLSEAQILDSCRSGSGKEEQLAYGIAFQRGSWQDAMSDLYDLYVRNVELQKARKILEALELENPLEPSFFEKAAMLCGELKDMKGAIYHFKKAFYLSPSFEKARYLFVICFELDRPTEAMPYLDYAIDNNTPGLNLAPIKNTAMEIIRLEAVSAKDSTNVPVLNEIAHGYLSMGNKDGAFLYAEKVLRVDPKNKEALSMLADTKSK